MKAVLALLLSLAVFQSQALTTLPAFDQNKEYHYEYKARVVTGLKEDVNQFAGLGLKGVLVLQVKDEKVLIQLRDVKVGNFNQKFEQNFEGGEFVFPYEPVVENELSAHLSKPVSVLFENGVVRQFETHMDDPLNSINIKRAMLSLFQLNLEGVNKISIGKEKFVRNDVDSKIHKVIEDGIGGDCETVYELKDLKALENRDELIVIKNRLMDKCKNRPSYLFTNRQGYKCAHCNNGEEEELELHDPLRTVSRTVYKLKGVKSDFTINKIYNSARYIFMPFTNYGKTIINGINQTLILQEVVDVQNLMTVENAKVIDTLTYGFEHDDTDLTHAHVFQRNGVVKIDDFKGKFDQLFKVLLLDLDYTEDIKQHDLPGKFVELVHLLETLDYDQLLDLFNTYVNIDINSATKEQKYLQKVFYDVLSNVGTGPALLLIKHVIQNDKVDEKIAEQLLTSYPFFVKEANDKVIDEFGLLVKDLPHKPYSSLSSSGIMSFGHLLNKGLTTKPFDRSLEKSHITPEVAKKHFKILFELFNSAKLSWERLVYLSAFHNIGLEDTFPYMRQIIEDKEHRFTSMERCAALYATVKYVHIIPENILEVLIPIYTNLKEETHMRIAAFNLIMKTKPSFKLLHHIGSGLRFDNSREVQSYVYSTFTSLANNSWPCAQSIKEDVKTVLELIPSYDFGFGFSKNLMFDVQNEKYNYGGFYQLSWINSKVSPAPSMVRAKVVTNVLGWNFDNVEIIMGSSGLSGMREKLWGPRGLYNFLDTDKSVLNIFKRHPRNVNTVEKELQEIESSINLKEREIKEPKSFSMYIKVLGQVVKMQHLDETVLNLLSGDGLLPLPADLPKVLENGLPLNLRKLGNLADITYEVPTELGIPLTFNLDVPMMLSLKGNIKAKVNPGFFADERDNKKPVNLELVTDLESIMDYRVIGKVAITSPNLVSYGFGFTHEGIVKVPIKGALDYNFVEKKYNLKMIPTQKVYDILDVKTTPFTFIESENDLIPLVEEKRILPVTVMEKPIEKERTILKDYFGLGLKFWTRTEDHELLWKGWLNQFKSFISKYGRYFEERIDTFSPSLIKRFIQAELNRRLTMAFTPRMSPFEFKLTWEPNTESPVTEIIETVDLDVSHALLKPTPEQQNKEIEGGNVVYDIDYQLLLKGPVERKFNADLKLVVDPFVKNIKKIAFDFKRTPIPKYDAEPLMVCYNGVAKTPVDWVKLDLDEKIEIDATLVFGKDCSSGKKIVLKGIAEKSEEQKLLNKTPEKLPHWLKCQEYTKKGFKIHPECVEFINEFHNMNKITWEISYDNLPVSWRLFGRKVEDLLKHVHFENLETQLEGISNPEKKITLVYDYMVLHPWMHVTIMKPTENLKFKWIYIPRFSPRFQKVNPFLSSINQIKKSFLKDLFMPHCLIGGDFVNTYDNVLIEYPQTDCWQLAVKDVSKEDKFTILYKTITHNVHKKAIKAFFNEHKIEILPVDETSPLIVRVDGVKKDVTLEAPLVLKDAQEKVLTIVSMYGENAFIVNNRVDDIMIFFDGESISISANKFQRGHLTGLCGDFNGEKTRELLGPDMCVYKNKLDFAYSWSVRADTCTIPEHKKECVEMLV